MGTCIKCQVNPKAYKTSSYCRDCHKAQKKITESAYFKSRVAKWRSIVIKAKEAPCKDCGHKFHYCVMDFDHRPDTVKKFNISGSEMRNLEDVVNEMSKCDVICSNCHRVRTFKRIKDKQIIDSSK